jgi:hypothetical protein
MKMTIRERAERFEVSFYFPDSRLVDLEFALRLAGRPNGWLFVETEKRLNHIEYKVTDSNSSFLATVQFTHGFEPPTRAVFENRPPETRRYGPAYKRSVIWVVKEFLEECAGRALLSDAQKDKAVVELNRHDRVEV